MSKLPGVGKETFSKLKDLKLAGLSTPLDNYRILTGEPASEAGVKAGKQDLFRYGAL